MSHCKMVAISLLGLMWVSSAFAEDNKDVPVFGSNVNETNQNKEKSETKPLENNANSPPESNGLEDLSNLWQIPDDSIRKLTTDRKKFTDVSGTVGDVLAAVGVPGAELQIPLDGYNVSASLNKEGDLAVRAIPIGATKPEFTYTQTVGVKNVNYKTPGDQARLAVTMRELVQGIDVRPEEFATLHIPGESPLVVRGKMTKHGGDPLPPSYQGKNLTRIEVLQVLGQPSSFATGNVSVYHHETPVRIGLASFKMEGNQVQDRAFQTMLQPVAESKIRDPEVHVTARNNDHEPSSDLERMTRSTLKKMANWTWRGTKWAARNANKAIKNGINSRH